MSRCSLTYVDPMIELIFDTENLIPIDMHEIENKRQFGVFKFNISDRFFENRFGFTPKKDCLYKTTVDDMADPTIKRDVYLYVEDKSRDGIFIIRVFFTD